MPQLLPIIQALRPHHWIKNLLLFSPLVFAHRFGDGLAVKSTAIAFAAFCLAASAGYLVNDLRDRAHDAEHPLKRTRPLASGAVRPSTAIILALCLFALAAIAAISVSVEVLWYLLAYCTLSGAYSFWLKRRVFLDVLSLAALWTLRILAGGVASAVSVSDWLLALSVFGFVGLALLKRYADLEHLQRHDVAGAMGRGYLVGDRELVRTMGVSSSFLSVLVLAMYLTSAQVTALYRSPRLLWLICPLLLYWIAHLWFVAERGGAADDPLVAAIREPLSYVVGALISIVFALAV